MSGLIAFGFLETGGAVLAGSRAAARAGAAGGDFAASQAGKAAQKNLEKRIADGKKLIDRLQSTTKQKEFDRLVLELQRSKTAVALAGRPGNNAADPRSGALTAMHVLRDAAGDGLIHTEDLHGWLNDMAGGGYGYPYDGQDTARYPKVDPVLSAHPYFQDGPLTAPERGYPWPGFRLSDLGPGAPGSLDNPFNPLADNGELSAVTAEFEV